MIMALFIFLILILPIFLLFLYQNQKSNKNNLNLPPGPRGLPLLGNLLPQLDHLYLWQLSKKHGPIMSLRLGSKPVVVISSAKMAKEIMKTQDLSFCSRPSLLGQQKLSYNGFDLAFAPFNDYWREIRKICVVNLFNSNRSQSFHPIRESEVSHLLDKISKLSVECKPVNLSEAMISLTSNIIIRVAFGKRYKEEENEGSRFHELLKETQAMLTSFFVSDYFPSLGFFDKFTRLIHRLEKNFKEFDMFYDHIIQEHLDPSRSKPDQEDILDVLLQLRKDRSAKVDLTLDHIKGILMNVFVGGTNTSAATVVWAMTFLMKNPKAMKKAKEEVRSVIGNKGFVSEYEIGKLFYLKAVIKETMRLHPTLPLLIPRESIQYCNLNGYDISAKTLIYVNAWAIGRDPDVWKNTEEFYPERFIDNYIDLKGQDFELIPFGAGRRTCPGIFLGLANVELSLANLLYKFDWEMPSKMKKEDLDMEVNPGIALQRKNDLCLIARKYI